LRVFVDSSVWFAAANTREHRNKRAKQLLLELNAPLTSSPGISLLPSCSNRPKEY